MQPTYQTQEPCDTDNLCMWCTGYKAVSPDAYSQGCVQGSTSGTSQRNSIHLPTLNTVLLRKWQPT